MKRGASEYITKEHGSTPNSDTSDSGENTSKMANAAQLARRKMAMPKSRMNRSTTPTGPSGLSTPSNPFSSTGFGAQQTHSFNPPSSTFTFGGSGANPSMSFPPASQQSSSFNIPSGSSSFTFGMDTQSNPFANMNGTPGNEGGGGPGGGGGGMDNNMMDASPQKPASSAFNFGNSSQNTSSGGSLFGQQQQQPAPTFGGGLFGQSASKTEGPEKSSNLFGQTSQPLTNGFGSGTTNTLFGQGNQSAGTGFGGFGQPTQPATTSSQPSSSAFSFGASTSKPSESLTATSKPTNSPFSFGAPASNPPESSPSPSQQPSTSLFGTKSAPENTTATSTSQDGKPQTATMPPSSSKQIFNFGTPASSQPAPAIESKPAFGASSSTLFGQTPKQNETTSAPSPSGIFGQPSTSPSTAEPENENEVAAPANPFAGLFGSQPTPATAEKPKPLFGFGQTSGFGASTSQTANATTATAGESASKPGFSFGTPASSGTPSSSSLFNLNKPTPSAEPKAIEKGNAEGVNSNTGPPPAKRLFGQTLPAFGTPISQSSEPRSESGSAANPFANLGKPSSAPTPSRDVPPQANSTTPASQKTSTNLFGSTPSATQISQSKSTLFGNSTPKDQASSSNAFSGSSESTPTAAPQAWPKASQPTPTVTKTPQIAPPPTISSGNHNISGSGPIKRTVSTEGPPQIPRFSDPAKYVSYDENWRLKALNREFKDAIMNMNPDRHDFLLQVRNYLDHREAIGQGVGFYERVKAGSKRKATDVDDLRDDSEVSKKAKAFASPGSRSTNVGNSGSSTMTPSSNPFAGLSSPQPKNTPSAPKSSSDAQTSQLFRSMIPGAQQTVPPRSTTPPSSPPKKAAPEMPKFSMPQAGNGGGFAAAFAKQAASSAKKMEADAKAKRKAEDFDSDEEDEAAWEKKYEEEQKAKKSKLSEGTVGGFKPNFGPSSTTSSKHLFSFGAPSTSETASKPSTPSFKFGESATTSESSSEKPVEVEEVDSAESEETSGEDQGSEYTPGPEEQESEDDLPEDQVQADDEEEEEEEEASEVPDLPPSQSLFGRISRPESSQSASKPAKDSPLLQPASNSSFKPGLMFSNVGSSTPEKPGFSPLTPATGGKSSFVPATTFNFTSTPASASPASTPVAGASLFSGGAVREGPIPGEGLFGSRPSTPLNEDKPRTSLFGGSQFSSSTNDKTWKPGSGIRFGSPDRENTTAPSVEVTQATPPAKVNPFSGLFGNPGKTSSPAPSGTNGNPAHLGFTFSSTSLFPPSSGISSRATSPGLTDNESVATDNTEDYSNEPQTSLMQTNAGEENEDNMYESRAQAQRFYKADEIPEGTKIVTGWNKMGLGNLKILKDRDTNKVRILLRAEPSANVLLNARLMKGVDYKGQASGKNGGAVTFAVVGDDGKMQSWMLQVKTKEMANQLAKMLEDNKSN